MMTMKVRVRNLEALVGQTDQKVTDVKCKRTLSRRKKESSLPINIKKLV